MLTIFKAGLWIRIGSGFNDFVDFLDLDPWARKMKKKMHFSLTFKTFL
jgi:hypothetical protein